MQPHHDLLCDPRPACGEAVEHLRADPADGPQPGTDLAARPEQVVRGAEEAGRPRLAEATTESVGRRPRTSYSITPSGRRALAAWLHEPGDGPVIECEQLLKIFFAEHGTKADALSTLAAARGWAAERNEANLAAARAYLAGEGPFQHRLAQHMLVGAFLTDFYAMVARWAEWATTMVEQWPDDPSQPRLIGRRSRESCGEPPGTRPGHRAATGNQATKAAGCERPCR